jgi:hypothetical protein
MLPLLDDPPGVVEAIAAEQADQVDLAHRFETWGDDRPRGAVGPGERVEQGEAVEAGIAPHRLGCRAEPGAERAGESFVRAIAGAERQVEDVGRARGQLARGLGQPPRAQVSQHRQAGDPAEGMGEVEARHAAGIGNIGERHRFAEMPFDDPEGPGRQ